MRNVFVTLAAFAIVITSACNKIDAELVEKIQASQNKIQEIKTELEASKQNVSNLNDQLVKAPEGLKVHPEYGYNELFSLVSSFVDKYTNIQTSLDEKNTSLEALLAQYTDGELKKKEVEQQHESFIADMESFENANSRMIPVFDQVSASYAKMMATWQALSEDERNSFNKQASTGRGGIPIGGDTGTGTKVSPSSTGIPGATNVNGGTLKATDTKQKQ